MVNSKNIPDYQDDYNVHSNLLGKDERNTDFGVREIQKQFHPHLQERHVHRCTDGGV